MKTLFSGMESSSKLKTTETNIGLHQGREKGCKIFPVALSASNFLKENGRLLIGKHHSNFGVQTFLQIIQKALQYKDRYSFSGNLRVWYDSRSEDQ